MDWPALSYIYGTWGYAMNRAHELAAKHNQKTFLYRGFLNGRVVWVVAWDPKKE